MASRENRALSSGDDASNIPNARDWTQQAPESSNITFLEGVTEGDQPLDTDPTQQPLFVESAGTYPHPLVKGGLTDTTVRIQRKSSKIL